MLQENAQWLLSHFVLYKIGTELFGVEFGRLLMLVIAFMCCTCFSEDTRKFMDESINQQIESHDGGRGSRLCVVYFVGRQLNVHVSFAIWISTKFGMRNHMPNIPYGLYLANLDKWQSTSNGGVPFVIWSNLILLKFISQLKFDSNPYEPRSFGTSFLHLILYQSYSSRSLHFQSLPLTN